MRTPGVLVPLSAHLTQTVKAQVGKKHFHSNTFWSVNEMLVIEVKLAITSMGAERPRAHAEFVDWLVLVHHRETVCRWVPNDYALCSS